MTIVFLTRFFSPHIGGVEKHVEKVSLELIKKGHRVTVITLKHDRKLPDKTTWQGIKIIRLPYLNSKWGIWKNLWRQREPILAADIVHCHDVFFWYLLFRFLYPFRPVYTTFHGWEGKFPIPSKSKWLRKIWEKLSWGNICVGDYLAKWYGTKPNFVTYGAPTFRLRDRVPETSKRRSCLFIGRLETDTGISEYLKALRQIKKKFGFKTIFIGDGPYRKQAQKIGRVTGMVKDLRPWLKRPAFVFASSYLTIWEALSSGRPVFALYQNPLKKDYLESFPAAKFMFIAGLAKELVEIFGKIITRPIPTNRFIGKAQTLAKKQTWEKVSNQYLKLWKLL